MNNLPKPTNKPFIFGTGRRGEQAKKNIKTRILLRKQAPIESVNDQLKNICQIANSRHRSVSTFLVTLLAEPVAYYLSQQKARFGSGTYN